MRHSEDGWLRAAIFTVRRRLLSVALQTGPGYICPVRGRGVSDGAVQAAPRPAGQAQTTAGQPPGLSASGLLLSVQLNI